MSTNLEIESKALLTKDEYGKLISNFDASKIYEQINYYIDTAFLDLREQKCGLRIRTKNDEIELTLKVTQSEGKLEINQQISNISLLNCLEEDLFPTGEVADYIEQNLGIKTSYLHVLGKLITYRLDIEYKSSLISIDRSLYNGHEDYEIECEDDSKEVATNNLKEFLNQFGIPFNKNKRSKLRRFLETLA